MIHRFLVQKSRRNLELGYAQRRQIDTAQPGCPEAADHDLCPGFPTEAEGLGMA